MGDWGYNFQYQEYLGEVYAVAAPEFFFFLGGGSIEGANAFLRGQKSKKLAENG